MPLSSQLTQFANPTEGLTTADIPGRPPGPDEVVVKMLAAPINPADLNVIEGTYGSLPTLPAAIGNEGVGRIVQVGEGVTHLREGALVLPMTLGTWASEITIAAGSLIPLPDGVDIAQASMLTVNPATAWRILHDFVSLKPGDWIAQNAANSGVGRSMIQLAHACGFRTLNVVRRAELVEELRAAGGDVVVTEECDLRKEVKTLCAGAKPRLGLNAVGGSSALNIANSLAPGSPLVTFGAMSKQALKIPNGLVIFSDIRFQGFWLKRWRDRATPEMLAKNYSELAAHLANGTLHTPVAATFKLPDVREAVAAASKDQRVGKILLDLA